MTKLEFVFQLMNKLSGLPLDEIEDRVNFYSEMIDDRIEEGMTEEEAVSAVGNIDEIAAQIISDIPLAKIVKERIKPKKRLGVWAIVLIILGFPIWLTLLISAAAVVFSLYIVLWSVIISLWAVEISVWAAAFGALVGGIIFIVTGSTYAGGAVIAAGIVCAGLSIFIFFGCKAASKGLVILTKKLALAIKNCFIKREVA